MGSLAVSIITSDLASTPSLAVSIMPGGAALSNGVAAGGAAFVSSLGVGPGMHRIASHHPVSKSLSCYAWLSQRQLRCWGIFLSFRFLALSLTILFVQLICCTGGVFTLPFMWQSLHMRYSNWCFPLHGA